MRLPLQQLDWALQAALPHVGVDEDLPVLCAVHMTVGDGVLTVAATDRYTMARERLPISQTCDPFAFLLRAGDAGSLRVLLKTVLRGLEKDSRGDEPVDLAFEDTDDGPTLRVLGRDLDVRFTMHEHLDDYPRFDVLLDRILTDLNRDGPGRFPRALNPTLLARLVPLQRAGRNSAVFTFTTGDDPERLPPVVVRPADPEDDVVVAIMPIKVVDPSEVEA